ncbi:hypothetical protein [Gordonia sp. (in: high G+C Gram-positive bacteria)]|uniref:hypothetical protein n=1 Tax=Gordonia sp. (in: high G+C Gram-positive bacteria) TaxID=84139 RepID=UPI003C724DC0
MNIVEFVKARLEEETKIAGAMPDPAKYRRIIDALWAMSAAVINQVESNQIEPTDHPLVAGLLVPAHVWADHPDFDPAGWFPKMIGQAR